MTMTTLTARVITMMRRISSTRTGTSLSTKMRRKRRRVVRKRMSLNLMNSTWLSMMTCGTMIDNTIHSTLSISTSLPTRMLPLTIWTPRSPRMKWMRKVAKMRPTFTVRNSQGEGTEGANSNKVAEAAVAVGAEGPDATNNNQLAKGSEQGDVVKVVATDLVQLASHILCLSILRIPSTSSQLTSPQTLPVKPPLRCSNHNSNNNLFSSSNSPSTIDTVHRLQLALPAAVKNNPYNSNNSQASVKAEDRGEESSKSFLWPTRRSSLLQIWTISPAPSSSRSRMKAAKSHFPSGVAMDKVRNARIVRSVRKSGSHNAHLAL